MNTGKKLAQIAAGYALALFLGYAAAAINEQLMPVDVAQTSPGMVAFGDMVLFVFVAGVVSLAPTWFLLKLVAQRAPRSLVGVELLVAALGPASWLTMMYLGGGPGRSALSEIVGPVFGLFVAFVAIPRIVLGPVLIIIEGVTCLLVRQGVARQLLTAAVLLDLIPMGVFALHLARATHA